MDKFPKVSIMIPTYNQEDYIAEAVNSALMQDYENLEIIIADDCSTDRTGEIARRYTSDPRVLYIRNEFNLGRVGNYRNTLYKHATGDWVVNLDGDDYYTDKTFISRAVKTILSQKNVVCFFGNKQFPSRLHQFQQYKISDSAYLFPGTLYLKLYNKIGSFTHMATLYKREIAISDGLCYSFYGIESDFHGIVRLSVYGNVILAHETGFCWRLHKTNATIAFSNLRKKYIQCRRCQYLIMRDIGPRFSEAEKQVWLKNNRGKVKQMYIMDNLRFNHSLYSLKIGLFNFRFKRGYIIMYIKAIIAVFLKINLFK